VLDLDLGSLKTFFPPVSESVDDVSFLLHSRPQTFTMSLSEKPCPTTFSRFPPPYDPCVFRSESLSSFEIRFCFSEYSTTVSGAGARSSVCNHQGAPAGQAARACATCEPSTSFHKNDAHAVAPTASAGADGKCVDAGAGARLAQFDGTDKSSSRMPSSIIKASSGRLSEDKASVDVSTTGCCHSLCIWCDHSVRES